MTPSPRAGPVAKEQPCRQGQGQEGPGRGACRGTCRQGPVRLRLRAICGCSALQQCPNWPFRHYTQIHYFEILDMRKTNKKSIKIITRSSNITFASEREELYEPLNIISTAVNF